MKTGILEFCRRYKEKLMLDKDIEDNPPKTLMVDHRDRITFRLNMTRKAPSTYTLHGYDRGINLIDLDYEDLEYLYNKYLHKAVDEMQENIDDLKRDYGDL